MDPEVIGGDRAGDPVDKVVAFVPEEHADAVRSALVAAGAGRIGDYDNASFTSVGEDRFRRLDGAHPSSARGRGLGGAHPPHRGGAAPGSARSRGRALLAAHPYEEPSYDVLEFAVAPGGRTSRGHGRIGDLAAPTTLRDFADRVDAALPGTAHGVRVAGDPDRVVRTVAVGSGSGDHLLGEVLGTGADVYLTSDLRHHRAGEFLGTTARPSWTWRTGPRSGPGCRSSRPNSGRRWRSGALRWRPGSRPRHRPVDLPRGPPAAPSPT